MAPENGLRPFRFGVVGAAASSPSEWQEVAQRAEAQGFSVLLVPDTATRTFSPIPALAVVAARTTALHLGTYVLVNDFRNPVLTAREASTLSFLTGGRFELGLGVGRPGVDRDLRSLGMAFDPGGVRVSRLEEALVIIHGLLRGEKVSTSGRHYQVAEAELFPAPPTDGALPIMVAASGRRLLALAARAADIVALATRAETGPAALKETIEIVRQAAGDRFHQIELHSSLAVVPEDTAVREMMRQQLQWFGLSLDQMLESGSPTVVRGTPEQMAVELLERRETYGTSYFSVPDFALDAFAPVVARLAGQ
jgi:probable F420-dependent oxidoreductase